MAREQTVCMMRIKNEARWIGRNLERTWQVCSKVVLWDDGSTDETEKVARQSITTLSEQRAINGGVIFRGETPHGPAELHFLDSPYTSGVRAKERANEVRDKNCLWWYVKSAVDFRHVLCLDGDEMLSKAALRAMNEVWVWLEGGYDWVLTPFVYLWDKEDQRRVDGIYGDDKDGIAKLRFPRIFTIKNLDEQQLFDTSFRWLGSRGGIHCGSIPQDGFHAIKPKSTTARDFRVIHFGYLDHAMRVSKYQFYNTVDPGNQFEGFYQHIIGEPNQHAPGPVTLIPWADT